MQLDHQAIAALPRRYRAQLINCLPGFKPVALVGTENANGEANLAVISSLFHIGASPPLLGMILRPNPKGTERHTLENILNMGHYTINGVTFDHAPQAHQTSARYPREQSEFSACGFTALRRDPVCAPFVDESPLQLGCVLREHQQLAINATHLIIGEVIDLNLPDHSVRDDGSIDLSALGMATATGLDSYHRVEAGQRFAYAKPEDPPTEIE